MISLLTKTAKSTKGKLALALLGVLAIAASGAVVYAAKAKPDFKLSVTKSKTVSAGGSTNFTVKVKRTGGFKKNVTLGVKGLPGGAKAAWKSKTKVKGKVVAAATCKKKCNVLDPKTSSATLTITTSNGTPIGTDKFTVTGKGGGVSHSIKNLQLVVQPPAGIVTPPSSNNTGGGGGGGGSNGGTGGTTVTPSANPTFGVSPTPATQNVVQSDTASYTINIDRSGGYTGPVSFGVEGLPTGATATFSPASTTTGNTVTMNVDSGSASTGNHPLTVRGTASGLSDQTTTVNLNVQGKVPFDISGDPSGIAPGVDTPVDLLLTNHYNFAIKITGLTVTLPGSTGNVGCSISDFSVIGVGQDLSTTPVTLPANATNTALSTLLTNGSTDLPKIRMTETGVNQDACKGASLGLTYSGTATK